MRKLIISIIGLCGIFSAQAQIAIPTIPDSLKENAHAVLVAHQTEFDVKDEAHATLRVNQTICILDKYGKKAGDIYQYYDQFRSINALSATLYDQYGKVIEKYKMKDFADQAVNSSSIASDGRIKALEPRHNQYPYFVQMSYQLDYQGLLHYPGWEPQESARMSVLHAKLDISSPKNNPIRYQASNLNAPKVSEEAGRILTKWEVHSIPTVLREPLSGSISHILPSVKMAPSLFEIDGFRGEMKDWHSYGKWQNQLNQSRNTLNPSQLEEVKSLVAPLSTKEEKLKAVYNYLQENTRYVSIQLGIGGWQPFETSLVHEKKYGDCKALSFYTKALLDAVGITAYYTKIKAGYTPQSLSQDFPYAHSNHIILTVPLEQDTIWLECTSQTGPFGYQGTFTSDRDAMIVTEEGGKLIHTRTYTAEENLQRTHSTFSLDKEGKAQTTVNRRYRGIEIENDNFHWILLAEEQAKRNWFFDQLDWGGFELSDYKFQPLTDEVVPEGGFSAEVMIPRAASKSGDRLFMKPFQFTDISYIKLPKGERKQPIKNYYAYTQLDSAEIVYPEAYHPEKTLEDVTLKTDFGSYTRTTEIHGNRLLCIRKFVFNKGTYAPERYEEFRGFIRKVQKYDRQKIVLLGNT